MRLADLYFSKFCFAISPDAESQGPENMPLFRQGHGLNTEVLVVRIWSVDIFRIEIFENKFNVSSNQEPLSGAFHNFGSI